MTEQLIIKLAIWLGAWLGTVALLVLIFLSINYRQTETHLVITLLGIPVRRIRIREIRHMGTDPKFWAERWYNTFSPLNRRLVIRRKSGLFARTLIITPRNPYQMMHDLEKAKEKLKAAEAPAAAAPSAALQSAAQTRR